MGISRGCATTLVRQLESRLGARLLQRTTRQRLCHSGWAVF
ncbi:hypothetical protein NPS46_05645 [Pseudomonas putida]|nr:hypothetical protein [Pseudomonas putida]MDD2052030.1 hypothetical protein [Pseudomonas putida]